MDIYIFNIQEIENKEIMTHYEGLKYLQELGFNVNPVRILCKNIDEVLEAIKK